MTYVVSAAVGGFKVGVREALVGVLGGVASIGGIASYINNIGACLAIGAVAGIVSGLWLRLVYHKVNEQRTYDPFGLIGALLINAVLGTFFFAPIVFAAYKK